MHISWTKQNLLNLFYPEKSSYNDSPPNSTCVFKMKFSGLVTWWWWYVLDNFYGLLEMVETAFCLSFGSVTIYRDHTLNDIDILLPYDVCLQKSIMTNLTLLQSTVMHWSYVQQFYIVTLFFHCSYIEEMTPSQDEVLFLLIDELIIAHLLSYIFCSPIPFSSFLTKPVSQLWGSDLRATCWCSEQRVLFWW